MLYYIHGETINVIVASDMPIGMCEHIWRNHDGSYTVKLNAKYDSFTLRHAFSHAIKHIERDDFSKHDISATEIEMEAHS